MKFYWAELRIQYLSQLFLIYFYIYFITNKMICCRASNVLNPSIKHNFYYTQIMIKPKVMKNVTKQIPKAH